MTGIVIKASDNQGTIRVEESGELVKFDRSCLLPAKFYTRGARVGDAVRLELANIGFASRVWLVV